MNGFNSKSLIVKWKDEGEGQQIIPEQKDIREKLLEVGPNNNSNALDLYLDLGHLNANI